MGFWGIISIVASIIFFLLSSTGYLTAMIIYVNITVVTRIMSCGDNTEVY